MIQDKTDSQNVFLRQFCKKNVGYSPMEKMVFILAGSVSLFLGTLFYNTVLISIDAGFASIDSGLASLVTFIFLIVFISIFLNLFVRSESLANAKMDNIVDDEKLILLKKNITQDSIDFLLQRMEKSNEALTLNDIVCLHDYHIDLAQKVIDEKNKNEILRRQQEAEQKQASIKVHQIEVLQYPNVNQM